MNTHQFSRRTFLRGLGVTMALPWLESLPVWGDEPTRQSRRPARRRCGWPCSSPATAFTAGSGGPRATARAWSWARCSRRSTDFREKMLFIRGLYNDEALKGNIHSSQTGNLLSGAPLASGGEIRSGTSIDQLVAQRHGRSTKVPSLVLGCEKSNPSVHKNYSMLYSSHISWSSPTTPTPLELYPALAFDRLFKDEVGTRRQERARRRARRRQGLSPQHQRHRPAQARRVSRLGARGRAADRAGRQDRASCKAGGRRSTSRTSPARADGIPQNIADHMRLMCDILVLGFQTDTTRDLHAQAEQRPLARCGSRTWAWIT